MRRGRSAAAVGGVVDLEVPAGRVVAQLVQADLDHAALARAAQHTGGERRGEHLREEGEDVETHGRVTRGGRGAAR